MSVLPCQSGRIHCEEEKHRERHTEIPLAADNERPGLSAGYTVNTNREREVLMKSIVSIALICLMLSSAPAWALFESDKELSEKARITMVEALKTAEKGGAGQARGSEHGKERRTCGLQD